MNDRLSTAIEAYAQARDAYFDLNATENLETLRNVYDCAAHRVAFLMWLDSPANAQPPASPDMQRVMASIEQHDPEQAIIEPGLEHWLAIGRDPSEFFAEVIEQDADGNVVHQLSSEPILDEEGPPELPAYLTDDNVFEAMIHQEFWEQNNAVAQALDELSGGTECRDCGTRYLLDDDARCPRCAAAKEGIEDPEPDENQDADSSDWTTAATEEDIQSWASDSRDLEDFFDEDDDWDDSDWYDDHGDDWSYYGSDDDYEEADDGSNHASRDPLSGKCYCPYCNSECAPDVCLGCHSELTPPAIDTEIRTDLPDEPPF